MINLAFSILPLVMVISRAFGDPVVLAHPAPDRAAMALVLSRALGLGGAVALASAATVFFGKIESQLLIRPCLARMARTELFILFTVGLAVIAGTMFVLYATMLKDVLPGALGHVLVASMMSLPAAVMIARVMVPGRQRPTHPAQEGCIIAPAWMRWRRARRTASRSISRSWRC